MNDWTAWYKDLLNLIKIAQTEVKNQSNIDLIPEVRIINN
jgi:UDP-N-acetylenolpyruvoylglucosamine reductase